MSDQKMKTEEEIKYQIQSLTNYLLDGELENIPQARAQIGILQWVLGLNEPKENDEGDKSD